MNRRLALVIDDDPDMRDLIAALLETIGFDSELVADGLDALKLTAEHDVIIVDLNMPVFDGARLLDYWLLTRPRLLDRVIVLTGYSRYAGNRLLPATFARISKPFDQREFLRLVEECAEKRRK